jgi:hypothetical protein
VNRSSAFLLIACSSVCLAQTPQIKSGSTVYIAETGNGYEIYLAAAFTKQHVPLTVVADKSEAEYIITSTGSHQVPNQPETVINNSATATINEGDSGNHAFEQGWAQGAQVAAQRRAERDARGSTTVSIAVVDPLTKRVLFAYSTSKAGTNNQTQKTAEACAKSLKEFIEKSEKPKK